MHQTSIFCNAGSKTSNQHSIAAVMPILQKEEKQATGTLNGGKAIHFRASFRTVHRIL
jgi:hypothetical protein